MNPTVPLGEVEPSKRAILIVFLLRLAAVLSVITACTGLTTHYVRGDWFSLLSSAVLVEAAVNASLAWFARRDPIAATRIAFAVALSVIPDFEIWEDMGSRLAIPIVCAVFSIGIVAGLWPWRVGSAKKQ